MASSEALQKLVEEDFIEICRKKKHGGRPKHVFRLSSCDTVCTRCNFEKETTITIVKCKKRNAVWLNEIKELTDCSRIKRQNVERGGKLIFLNKIHTGSMCEEDSFCSLACKLKYSVKKKKRTGGRRKAEMTIFHRFYMILLTRKPRSGGRRRRAYRIQDGHLPPKKRNRGA